MPAALDVADLAADQWGLVTTAQARSLGVSAQAVARLTHQGALDRVTHGVYRVTGAPPSPLDDLRAAWLALEPARRAAERLHDEAPTVVSHRSAAAIHELGDLESDEFEFTSAERKQTRRPDIRIHRGQVNRGEWTVVDGLPVTTVIRTVTDLAATHIDGGHLASMVRDALTRQQVDDQNLAAALRPYAQRYGVQMGNGEALLSRLLQESGISEPIERAVELAAQKPPSELARPWDVDPSIQIRQLTEQLAAVERAISSAAQLSEQTTHPPAALQELAKHAALTDAPMRKALADLARYVHSPTMRRLAHRYPEVAEIERLERMIREASTAHEVSSVTQEDSH